MNQLKTSDRISWQLSQKCPCVHPVVMGLVVHEEVGAIMAEQRYRTVSARLTRPIIQQPMKTGHMKIWHIFIIICSISINFSIQSMTSLWRPIISLPKNTVHIISNQQQHSCQCQNQHHHQNDYHYGWAEVLHGKCALYASYYPTADEILIIICSISIRIKINFTIQSIDTNCILEV